MSEIVDRATIGCSLCGWNQTFEGADAGALIWPAQRAHTCVPHPFEQTPAATVQAYNAKDAARMRQACRVLREREGRPNRR